MKNKIMDVFKKYFKDVGLFNSLEKFLDCKEAFLQDKENEYKEIDMINAYEYIYSDMKYWLSAGKISKNDFQILVDLLKKEDCIKTLTYLGLFNKEEIKTNVEQNPEISPLTEVEEIEERDN